MSVRRFWRTCPERLVAVVGGVAAAEAVWLVAELVFGIHVQAPAGSGYPQPVDIGPGMVALAAAVLALCGWGVLAVLERLTARARGMWLVLALLALVASLGLPLSGSGVPTAGRVVLVLMHLAVAVIVVPALYRTSHARPRRPVQTSAQSLVGEAA